MSASKGHIPTFVLWGQANIATLIVGIIMSLIVGAIYNDNSDEQKTMNAFLIFKDALYREIVGSPERTQNQDIQVMANYLREQEHQEDFNRMMRQEAVFRDSLDKAQRLMLHVQNPDKLSQGLLIMTNSSHWKKLRENPQDRAMLIEILYNNIQPPEITLRNDPNLSRVLIWLWVLIPQLCGFLLYLLIWIYDYDKYRWYQLSLVGKAGFVLLMPGAGIMIIPMIMWAWCRGCIMWLKWNNKEQHARREALKKGASLDIPSDASKALLRKLQQGHTRQQKETRSAGLV